MAGARWRRVAGGILLGSLMAAPVAWASTESVTSEPSYVDGALRKLGRGVANVITCPAEILRTAETVRIREGFLAAASVGLVRGLARTVQRGVVGIFEIATFYAEVPEDFQPLMRPEFVFMHGDWAGP